MKAESGTAGYKPLPSSSEDQADPSYSKWTCIIVWVLSLYEAIVAAFEGAFMETTPKSLAWVNMVVACFLFVNMIYMLRMKKIYKWTEVVITIGDVASFVISPPNCFFRFPFYRCVQLLRVIHWVRVFTLTSQLQKDTIIKYRMAQSIKLAMVTVCYIHNPACLLYYMASDKYKSDSSWIGLAKQNITTMGTSKSYLLSFYFATSTATTVGFGDFYPDGTLERVFCVLYMLAGIIYLSYMFQGFDNIFSKGNMNDPAEPTQVGLANERSNCYLNCVIQCLSHTTQLMQDVLPNDAFRHDELARAFQDLMRQLHSKQHPLNASPVDPSDLLAVVLDISKAFEKHKQNDCHEFLSVLFDNFKAPMSSVIEKIFQVCIRESSQCSHCGWKKDERFINCSSLSLAISSTDPRRNQRENSSTTLEVCLKNFFKVSEEESTCQKCEKKKEYQEDRDENSRCFSPSSNAV